MEFVKDREEVKYGQKSVFYRAEGLKRPECVAALFSELEARVPQNKMGFTFEHISDMYDAMFEDGEERSGPFYFQKAAELRENPDWLHNRNIHIIFFIGQIGEKEFEVCIYHNCGSVSVRDLSGTDDSYAQMLEASMEKIGFTKKTVAASPAEPPEPVDASQPVFREVPEEMRDTNEKADNWEWLKRLNSNPIAILLLLILCVIVYLSLK